MSIPNYLKLFPATYFILCTYLHKRSPRRLPRTATRTWPIQEVSM